MIMGSGKGTFIFCLLLMVMDLNIMTWNANGITSSSSYLYNNFSSRDIDIFGVAKHWWYEKDLTFLNQINTNYKCHAVSDFDLMFPGHRRVGEVGVALLWHKRLDDRIISLSFEDDTVIGLQLEISSSVYIYVFQVYLPCSNHQIARFMSMLINWAIC